MAPESTEKEKLQHVYRLQQSKLVSISNLTETLGNIRENLEVFSAEQNILTGELENCTNRSRLTIRRLERKGNKEENEENIENDDYRLLSPSRKKS
ncbi:chemotaxis protein, partial [Salmonella enterica subsp. diarizonae]|nr:chemotaxis protein [Salmonella enterica subsp. diarizonae]